MPDIFLIAHRAEITSLAARYRLPAVFPYRYFPALGGLQSYGNGCYAQAQARLLSVSGPYWLSPAVPRRKPRSTMNATAMMLVPMSNIASTTPK